MEDEEILQSGAYQNIARVRKIMDALASTGNCGLRMIDAVHLTGLKKSVVHRALIGLSLYGLASHDKDSGRFYLGDQIFSWMHTGQERFALADRIKPHLAVLANDIEDTINFSVRRGDYAVCYARAEGCSPIQFLTLSVGDARPLGAGSGTLAIMAFLPEAELEEIVERCDAELKQYGITKETLRRNIEQTRQQGYAIHEGLVAKEMLGIGIPIRNLSKKVVASFSVVALCARLQPPRRDIIVKRMCDEAMKVEKEMAPLLESI